MNEVCVFCRKNFGLFSPLRVAQSSNLLMCRKCQADYRNKFVEKIRLGNQSEISEEIQRIKRETNNNSATLDQALADILQEETIRLSALDEEKEKHDKIEKEFLKIRDIQMTTEDIQKPYKILGPIIFNTTNRGVFSSIYGRLSEKYSKFPYDILLVKPHTESLKSNNAGVFFLSLLDASLQFEGDVGQSSFDRAFYIGLAEMKVRTAEMGGNAIVGMKMDFDLDTTNFGAFYLQMYGTAILLEE